MYRQKLKEEAKKKELLELTTDLNSNLEDQGITDFYKQRKLNEDNNKQSSKKKNTLTPKKVTSGKFLNENV